MKTGPAPVRVADSSPQRKTTNDATLANTAKQPLIVLVLDTAPLVTRLREDDGCPKILTDFARLIEFGIFVAERTKARESKTPLKRR